MMWNRSLLLLLLILMPRPAQAQRHHAGSRGGQASASHPAPSHLAQGRHAGAMTLEQHMEHEFWQQQWMLSEMMMQRRTPRHSTALQSRQGSPAYDGDSQTTVSQSKAGSGQRQAASNSRSTTSLNGFQHDGPSPSTNETEKARPQSSGKHASHGIADSRHPARGHEHEGEKQRSRERSASRRNERVSDSLTTALLKNVHATLHKADVDYQGHRVKAMRHVTEAIRHLGATAVPQSGNEYGGGHLPQAESDRLLDDAMFHLRRIEGTLGTGTNLAAHHARARMSVAEAKRELEIARNTR